MRLQGFDVAEKLVTEFIYFVKRLELLMPEQNDTDSDQVEKTPKKSNKHERAKKDSSENEDDEFYCAFHGANNAHNTNDCCTIGCVLKDKTD